VHDTKLHPNLPDYISKQDCRDNTTLSFTLADQTSLANVQVWVSDNKDAKCWSTDYRDKEETQKNCVSLQMSLNDNPFVVNAQTVIGRLADANAGECTDTSGFAGHARQLYIFFVDTAKENADGIAGNKVYAMWDKVWVDLEGPAPTDFKLGTGEESLIVRYDTAAVGSDVTTYSFYCAPIQSGERGESEACPALPDLTPGQVPSAPGDCESDASGPSGMNTLKGLTNGTTYTVAMAAQDNVDNLGALSEFQCGTPEATKSFFDAYREEGGQAGSGCGLCSAGGDTPPTLPALAGGALAIAVFAGRRRRRRDIPRGPREAE
jgi:MYXO-CTERM domain-containing protein